MVESAFGSLRVEVDELLADRPAVPARRAGADLFASDPKALLGSLLKFKEGEAAEGGGRFATVRVHQGHRVEQGVARDQGLARGRQHGDELHVCGWAPRN